MDTMFREEMGPNSAVDFWLKENRLMRNFKKKKKNVIILQNNGNCVSLQSLVLA